MKKVFAVKQILSPSVSRGGSGIIDVAPMYFSKCTTKPTTVTHAATAPLTASELVNSQILNTGAGGAIALTVPSAAAILAAFLASGIVLTVGDTFTVLITAAAAFAVTLSPSGSVTVMSGGTVVVPSQKSAVVTFLVTSTTVSAETMQYSATISN
jgi:hypothetical protein